MYPSPECLCGGLVYLGRYNKCSPLPFIGIGLLLLFLLLELCGDYRLNVVATETVAECDDDDDDDEVVEDETERNCQDAAEPAAVNGDSVSMSPHDAADQSEEETELDSPKSKLPKSGLRIKLSLKPVRKSTREHKAPVSIHGWLVLCHC